MRLPLVPACLIALAASAAFFLGGCRDSASDPSARSQVIRVWCHQGQEAENRAMREIAAAFNTAHADRRIRVSLTFFPDYQYTEKLAIAAAAGDLPDAFDLDGPLVARLATAGLLAPLDPWFTPAELADFLPTIIAQGTVDHQLYALGAFESAAVLYYDRTLLATAGVTPPPAGESWTWDEFLAACAALRTAGIEPVALHMNETADEWFTYAFAPVVWSGGGQLIATDENQDRVSGVLASPANLASVRAWQTLFTASYAATDPVDPDPFGSGRTAMDWSGHWMAQSHLTTKGDRLGAMPLPHHGERPVAPCGSWCWGISASAADVELASLWIKWVTDARHGVEPIVRANGAVPARRSAFAAFPEYADPPYRIFRDQLENFARPRPRTPYYATLTQRFASALRDISHGADVATRLRTAETEIQRVIDRRASP